MEYTPEQLNYFRACYIAFNLVPEGLRKIFKQEWNFRYKTTPSGEWKDTPQNGLDFYSKESRRNRKKYARYLATIQNGNATEWDCSCLSFAILFSDSIGTTLSPAIGRDVDSLRHVRNDVAHISVVRLTDSEFKNYVTRVLLVFTSLGLPVNDVEVVKNQTSFPTAEYRNLNAQADKLEVVLRQATSTLHVTQTRLQRKEKEVETLASDLQVARTDLQTKEEEVEALTQEINSKMEPFCNLTFTPSHEIITRSNDLTRIVKKMRELEEGKKGAVSTIYLSGIPGCGKSEIARQLGQQFFNARSKDSGVRAFVATLNAETLETLADSYITLAKQLGVTEYTLTKLVTTKVGSPKETIQHLKLLILPRVKQFSKWLIIADNVTDLSLVRSHLPQTASKGWGHGQVLITAQDSSIIPTNSPRTYHESLSRGMQPDDAVELLKQVSQISNHDQSGTVAEVLEYQPLALATAAFYVHTVVNNRCPNYTWTKYLETLAKGERGATEEPLAKENTAYSKTMTSAVKMAVKRSSENDDVLRHMFSFLSLCASESLPVEAVVSFVQVCTTGLTEEVIKAKILRSSLITCLYGEDGTPEYLRVHNIVHEVLTTFSFATFGSEHADKVLSMCAAIKILHPLINKERERLFDDGHTCVKLRKITTHCKVLHQNISSSFATRDTLVKDFAPIITPDDLVSWLCSTAAVLCDLTNPSDANRFSTSACDFTELVSQTRDGSLLRADVFSVHGNVLSMLCQHGLSISYYKEANKIYADIHGKLVGKMATNYNNLGTVYRIIGKYHQAIQHHRKALIICKKIYNEENADVANSYNKLGNVYVELRQYRLGKEFYEKALGIRKKIYSEEHACVASSYNNLGNAYSYLKQYSQSKELYEKSLIIRKKIYGEEHADVAASYDNLGNIYSDLGQIDEGRELCEKALIIRKKIYGEEHVDVAASYNNLGALYRDLKQYDQACECHEKALFIRQKVYGVKHSDVADSYFNLGVVYRDLRQEDRAKEYHQKALTIKKTICREEHADAAKGSHSFAVLNSGVKKNNESRKNCEQVLPNRKVMHGKRLYGNLGNLYRILCEHNAKASGKQTNSKE